MPRSHLLHNQWRILLAALAIVLLLCTGFQADAQQKKRRKPAQRQQTSANSNSATNAAQQQPTKKNLTALRAGDSPEGGRATITSDAPLSDYEAYRSGNRYYVVIPQANAPSVPEGVRGRGFDDVQVHKRGNDTVLSFRLKPGTTARVNQKFNKLDVVFSSPAESSSVAQNGTGTTGPATGTANTGAGTANTNAQRNATANTSAKPPNAATAGPNANTPNATTGASPSSANTGATVAPPTATATPDTASLPTVTPALGPTVETPATAVASPTPPTDQVAQSQPAPSVPSAITTTPASSGISLGAVLRSNWPLILLAALLLIGIGLVVMNRSRARRGMAATRRISEPKTAALEEGALETAEAVRPGVAPVAGAVVAAGMAGSAAATEPADVDETETIETEPVEAFNVERVRMEIKHVLTGEPYDESVINAPVRETRQLIESELLFALSRRNTERRDRALKAFTEHGYFDDTTRDLRTAAVPAERAAAARKLGLTRDTASTPHLVAALEDTAPEVRRAAVEALTELQDPSSVAPLESLLDREEDRKVPHALIRRAIRASSASPVEAEEAATAGATPAEAALVEAAPVATEEVVSEEVSTPVAEAADVAVEPEATSVAEEPLSVPESPAPAGVLEVAPAEAASDLSAEAIAPAIVEGIATAQADAAERRRAEADAARIHAEQEAQRQTAEAERRLAEEESSRRRVEEAARLRAEAEADRLAEETRQREEDERRRIEAERLRVEEERRRTEEEQLRVEEERRRVEERQRLEEERRRAEEEQRRAEEERLRVEEEQRRAEEERRRVEAEAQRQREEEEAAARLQTEEERARAEEEARRHTAEERERQEEEARQRVIEEERLRAEDARRLRAEERERRRAEEERARVEAEERERGEADAARRRAEEAALRLADMRRRMEEETRQREEAEAERLRVEEEARLRAEEEEAAARQQEDERRAEEERRRVEAEAQRQREEEEAARQREEAEAARVQYELEAAERRQPEEAETPSIELEEIEPGQVETPRPTVQSDLFEATFTERTPYATSPEISTETAGQTGIGWLELDDSGAEAVRDIEPASAAPLVVDETAITEYASAESVPVKVIEEYPGEAPVRAVEVATPERGVVRADEDYTSVPGGILRRLSSESVEERAAAVSDLSRVGGADAFREISTAFDDPSQPVRDAAARALFNLDDDHAASFTRALREAPPERRRKIGNALATSGLASEAISHLMGESREKTYDAFSLLFLMSKAGEVQPLMRAIEEHPNSEVRLAVVKLLALSGQQEILPAFRRLAVRGSLPTEVRSAVMEAIYQISSQASTDTTPVA